MNLTLLSLSSTIVLSSSPVFVNKQITLLKSSFHYFCSCLFYTEKSLYLKDCFFKHGLNGVIHNEYDIIEQNSHISISNITFEQTYYRKIDEISSLTIYNCVFSYINASSIIIEGSKTTIYITDSLFTLCNANEPHIHLKSARYFTMTHTCISKLKSTHQTCILLGDYTQYEFCICLYNTVVESGREDTPKDSVNFLLKNCDSYFKCNNMTKSYANAIQFDSIRSFTFSMNSIIDSYGRCFQVTGQYSNGGFSPKYVEYVNLFSNSKYDLFDSKNSIFLVQMPSYSLDFIFRNSVILSQNKIFFGSQSSGPFRFFFENCVVNKDYNIGQYLVTFNDCYYVDYNENYSVSFPHYTFGEYCIGPSEINENEYFNDTFSAFACNVEKCLDINCSVTYGFPFYVVPFTTIPHFDLQTLTFSLTESIPPSHILSKSIVFSNPDDFSKSIVFSNPDDFSKSHVFSNPDDFQFTKSKKFSNSLIFSESFTYSPSPSQSDLNNRVYYSSYLSETIVSVRTVTYNKSITFSLTYFECTDLNGEINICNTYVCFQVFIPYIINSLSVSLVPTYLMQEIVYKKKLTSEMIIGVACLPVSAVFGIVGIIILVKTKRPSFDASDIYNDSSDFSTDNDSFHTCQKIVNINTASQKNDDWL